MVRATNFRYGILYICNGKAMIIWLDQNNIGICYRCEIPCKAMLERVAAKHPFSQMQISNATDEAFDQVYKKCLIAIDNNGFFSNDYFPYAELYS